MRRFTHREPAAAFADACDGCTRPLTRLMRQPKSRMIQLEAIGFATGFAPLRIAGRMLSGDLPVA
jgi:hypothetical protein